MNSKGVPASGLAIIMTAQVLFYSAAITRQREIEESGMAPGGKSPLWVSPVALVITIGALVAFFMLSSQGEQGHKRDLQRAPHAEMVESSEGVNDGVEQLPMPPSE